MTTQAQIEHIAIGAFDNIKSIDGSMITRDKFVHYAITTPEARPPRARARGAALSFDRGVDLFLSLLEESKETTRMSL